MEASTALVYEGIFSNNYLLEIPRNTPSAINKNTWYVLLNTVGTSFLYPRVYVDQYLVYNKFYYCCRNGNTITTWRRGNGDDMIWYLVRYY